MTIRIRRAEGVDSPLIAALSAQVWLDTYCVDGINLAVANHILSTFTADAMAAKLADPNQQVMVAERDSKLLGVLTLRRNAICPCDKTLRHELDGVYVTRHSHRQGIGGRMLARAYDLARRDGARSLWLTVWYRNARALAFYDALNWQRIGETQFMLDGVAHPNIVFRHDLAA
jgi:GNAT superfamily N-acetyltransferase